MPMSPRLLRPRASNRLLLDIYTGSAAAYSLRQLRSAHTTGVVRVRRSSDSEEADFRASEITSGTLANWVGAGNNGFVVTWYDQSGNARNVTQGTADNQPKLVSSGAVITESGKPAVDFDGSNDRLIHAGAAITTSSALSVFTVCRTRGQSVSHFVSSAGANVLGKGSGLVYTASEVPYMFTWGASPNAEIAAELTTRLLFTGIANGTALSVRANSLTATATTGTALSLETGNVHIAGSLNDASPLVLNGIIQESIFWFSNQTTLRADIEKAINTHYAIH